MFSNSTKVWLFIIFSCLLFLILGYWFGGRFGLFLGLIISVAFNALIFLYGENKLLKLFSARRLKGQDGWGLTAKLANLSTQLEIQPPALYLIESPTATAFSIGFAWRKPCLCLSSGLLEKFSDEEITAVLAHQLCHIQRMDSFSFGVTSVIANSLVGLGEFLDQLWPPNYFLNKKQTPFLTCFSPLGWLIIHGVINDNTYFENDLAAADLVKSRMAIGRMLWRLDGNAQTSPLLVPPCTSHLFIVNPEGFSRQNFFLKNHPHIESRLQKLMGYYPI